MGVPEGTRGSGRTYQRRIAGSIATAMALAGRGVVVSCGVWVGLGVGVGVVAAGVHEVTASPRANTCARYLKVR
jgi:hypothetical protein